MKRHLQKLALVAMALLLITGCNNPLDNKDFELLEKNSETYLLNQKTGQVHIVKNNSMYEVKKEKLPTNKINDIIRTYGDLKHTRVEIMSKIYNEFILYDMKVLFRPEKDSSITFKEWKDEITKEKLFNSISLLFHDVDGFKLKTERIYLKNITVNLPNAIGYEGKIKIDKYLASKINSTDFYYVFPEFEEKIKIKTNR